MTRDDFIATSITIVGTKVGWESKLAQMLNVSIRSVNQAVKDGPSDKLANAVKSLLVGNSPTIQHAEWIVGTDNEGRHYLSHTSYPRFRCMITLNGHEPGGDNGIQYQQDDIVLCAFSWIDPQPEDINTWLEKGCNELDASVYLRLCGVSP